MYLKFRLRREGWQKHTVEEILQHENNMGFPKLPRADFYPYIYDFSIGPHVMKQVKLKAKSNY